MAALYIGLDLGGSGTRAALVDASGDVLGFGVGPPLGHLAGAAGRRRVARSLTTALAGITPLVRDATAVVWAGTTGLSLPGRRDMLALELTTRFPDARVE